MEVNMKLEDRRMGAIVAIVIMCVMAAVCLVMFIKELF
jgi:Mg2+ and Co2+ transporter CorA